MSGDKGVVYIPVTDDEAVARENDGKTSHDKAVDDLLADLQGIGAVARVDIYKALPGRKSADQYCESIDGDKLDASGLQQYIRDTYGHGDYRILVFRPGKKGVSENKLLSIAAPKTLGVVAPPNNDNAMAGILQVMIQMQEQANQRFERLLTEMKTPARDPYEEQKKTLELMKLQREAMGISGAPATTTPTDPVKMLADSLALLKTVGELGGQFGALGAPREDDSVLGVVRELGPQIMSSIKTEQEIRAAQLAGANIATARRIQNPAPRNPAPVAQARPAAPNSERAPIMPREAYNMLAGYARNDADTYAVASAVVNNYPDEARAIVGTPRPMLRLLTDYPDAEDYAGWWADLLADLTNALEQAQSNGNTNPVPVASHANNDASPDAPTPLA